jgi:predicted amidohydrolase
VTAALRVAGIQMAPVWEDRDATLAAVTPLVERAAAAGGRLLVLAGMF